MSAAKTDDPKRTKKRKKLTLLVGALSLAAAAASAAWFVLQPGGEAAAAAAKKQLYQTLDVFTVNLQDQRGERFAQIGITVQYDNPDVELALKEHLPAVRNDVLLLLSSKTPEELLTPEGKQQLAQQIRAAVGTALGYGEEPKRPGAAGAQPPRGRPPANPIHAVLFSQFILQ